MNKKETNALVRRYYGSFVLRLLEQFIHLLFLFGLVSFACIIFVNVMSPNPSLEKYVADAGIFSGLVLGWDYFMRWREPVVRRMEKFGIPHTWIGPDWLYVEEIFQNDDKVGSESAFCLKVRTMYSTERRTGEWALDSPPFLVQVMIPGSDPLSLGLWKGCVIRRCKDSGIRRLDMPLLVDRIGPVNVPIE